MSRPVKPTRRYQSPLRAAQAASTRAQVLDAARTLFAAQGYAGHDGRRDRPRGGCGREDRLPRLRLEERCAAGAVGPHAQGRRLPRAGRRAALVRGGARGARPRTAAAPQRPQRPHGEGAHRTRPPGHPRRRAGGRRGRRALGADPDRLPRQPAGDRREPGREARAGRGPRRRRGHRHPLDAQPPRPLVPARRPLRLDPGPVRGVVRRHLLRAAPRTRGRLARFGPCSSTVASQRISTRRRRPPNGRRPPATTAPGRPRPATTRSSRCCSPPAPPSASSSAPASRSRSPATR